MAEAGTAGKPYPGPAPFSAAESAIFFGRTREKYEIFDLLKVYRTVLLYAQSGAGKTSLVNAGVRPLLEQARIRFVRIRVTPQAGRSATPAHPNPYIRSALESLRSADETRDLVASAVSLTTLAWPDEQHQLVLCFDQFEELFSRPDLWRERDEYLRELAQIVQDEKRINVHLLLVVREDYLATMLGFAGVFPGGLRIRYYLEQLSTAAALEAVTGPAGKFGKSFAPKVAERLIANLSQIQTEARGTLPWQTGTTVEGEFVEPVHLQIVCAQLWAKVGQTAQIQMSHLIAYADVDRALTGFYEDALEAGLATGMTTEAALREWFGSKLVTSRQTRGLVFQDKEKDRTEGMPNRVVRELEERHVIRPVQRGSDFWFEITHDRLVKPILDSNSAWRQRQTTIEKASVALGAPVIGIILLGLIAILAYTLYSLVTAIAGHVASPLVDVPVAPRLRLHLGADASLFYLVISAATVGSSLAMALSFVQALGTGRLTREWVVPFVLRIPTAVALAAVCYMALRAFLLPSPLPWFKMNAYGFAALFGLVGFYSKEANELLSNTSSRRYDITLRIAIQP